MNTKFGNKSFIQLWLANIGLWAEHCSMMELSYMFQMPMKKDIARNMKIWFKSTWNENLQYNKFMHNLFVHKFPFFWLCNVQTKYHNWTFCWNYKQIIYYTQMNAKIQKTRPVANLLLLFHCNCNKLNRHTGPLCVWLNTWILYIHFWWIRHFCDLGMD